MSTAPTAPDAFAGALAGAVTPATCLDAAYRAVVHAATLAPSVHNSQPWSFTMDDGGLDLYADDARRLPVLDPEGRLVRLSCGAALLHAQVAARAFEQRALPPGLLDRLRLAAEEHGAALIVVRGDDLIELEVLLAWADGVEEADPAYRAETAASVRTGLSTDGIPAAALADDPERGSSLRLRDFAFVGPRPAGGEPHGQVALSQGDVDGGFVECWLHGSRFDLTTGQPTGPPATAPVPVYPVRVVAGVVEVAMPAPTDSEDS